MKIFLLVLFAVSSSVAQTTRQSTIKSELCTEESAVHLINEQIATAKTLDDPVQRITLMLRGADLLWLYQAEKARATFADAFELAKQTYDPQGDAPKRAGVGLLVDTPDQRYVVIRAIAKRDARWARKLTDELLTEARATRNDSPVASEAANGLRTSQKLLETAMSLLPQDTRTALGFADASLRFPADYYLTAFLYRLAEADQNAADEFYRRALVVYAEKPLREFLYLAAYPFALDTTSYTPATGGYRVPATFRADVSLQTLFARTLSARAQRALASGVDEQDNYNGLSGVGHITEVIPVVEPLIRKQSPELAAELVQTRGQLLNTLSPNLQAELSRPEKTSSDEVPQTFAERIEAIEKNPNADRRDELLVTLVLNAGPTEPVDNVTGAASKITDTTVRSQVLDWFYFNRAQSALKEKNFDDASSLASRVQELDQRAYLYSDIAKTLARQPQTQVAARALLEQIVTTAEKAPNTLVTARAFLAAANLYLKFDADRAVSVLTQAIKSINQLKDPDFGQQWFFRKIEGRNFARYAAFKTASFDPESAFREFASINIESAFAQSSAIADKALRGHIALALADFCLARPKAMPKPTKARADAHKIVDNREMNE
jgi:tetratricopeptide (TPR) repeat protein